VLLVLLFSNQRWWFVDGFSDLSTSLLHGAIPQLKKNCILICSTVMYDIVTVSVHKMCYTPTTKSCKMPLSYIHEWHLVLWTRSLTHSFTVSGTRIQGSYH
jgi:hypothetical protein